MPGFELVGKEELAAIQKMFEKGGGNLYRYGPKNHAVKEFEKEFAQYFGVKYAYAVSSGTAAIHCALAGIGVGSGDEVITTAFTFIAPVEAIAALGARPVPVEIDETYHLDPEEVKKAITPKTKAVVSIPMWASPKMDALLDVCREAGIPLIEDAAQCLGGTYQGKKMGTLGVIGSFSFDMGKTMTVGEGGMFITNDEEVYRRASEFSDHGHMHTAVPRGQDPRRAPGLNYRMSEVTGAMGLAQLSKVDKILAGQRSNKKKVKDALRNINGLEFRGFADEAGETGDTLIFALATSAQAKQVAGRLAEKGFGSKILPEAFDWHYAGAWGHLLTKANGYDKDPLSSYWPRTYERLSRSVALPIFVSMGEEKCHQLVTAVEDCAASVSL